MLSLTANPRVNGSLTSLFQAIAILLFSLAIWSVMPLLVGEQGMGDRERYLAIAETPFALTESPWGYRIAVPWLARGISEMTGIKIEDAFQILQFLFYYSINLLLARSARRLGASVIHVPLILLVFAAGYQFVYYRFNYIHVGMSELSLLGWLCWFLYNKKYSLVLTVLVFSILVKESIAFVFLNVLVLGWLYDWLNSRKTDISLLRLLVICVVPVVLFVSIRLLWAIPGESGAHSYFQWYDSEFFDKLYGKEIPYRLVEYFTVFGTLHFLVLYSIRYVLTDPFIRLQLLVFVASISQLLLALDTRRMASMAVIAVLLIVVRLIVKYGLQFWAIALLIMQILYCFLWLNQIHNYAIATLGVAAIFSGCYLATIIIRNRYWHPAT